MEVGEKQWQQFCERIQQVAHGAVVNIGLLQPDGSTQPVYQNVPFQRMALDQTSDPCNNLLVIEAGFPGEKPARHVVVEPIHIRLKDGGDAERYHQLHVLAENGTTIVVFHPGLNAGLMKGLE